MLWVQGMDRARIQRVEQDLRGRICRRGRWRPSTSGGASRAPARRARAAWEALRGAGFGAAEMKEIAFTVAIDGFQQPRSHDPGDPVAPDRAHARAAPHAAAAPAGRAGSCEAIASAGRRRALDRVPPYPYVPARGGLRRLADRARAGAHDGGDVGLAASLAALQAADVRRRLARPAVRGVRARGRARRCSAKA